MLIDLNTKFDQEVAYLHEDLIQNKGFEWIDHEPIVGVRTPFQVIDGVNELVYYIIVKPGIQVLHYFNQDRQEVFMPWVQFQFSLREDLTEQELTQVFAWFRDLLANSPGIKPFKDEDANFDYFTKGRYMSNARDYEYSFFMNFDYKNGWWDNHTIDCIY
jgi:hypothetical protein